jgi:hypothetical protein
MFSKVFFRIKHTLGWFFPVFEIEDFCEIIVKAHCFEQVNDAVSQCCFPNVILRKTAEGFYTIGNGTHVSSPFYWISGSHVASGKEFITAFGKNQKEFDEAEITENVEK